MSLKCLNYFILFLINLFSLREPKKFENEKIKIYNLYLITGEGTVRD